MQFSNWFRAIQRAVKKELLNPFQKNINNIKVLDYKPSVKHNTGWQL